jgi:hypothetical protein
MGARSHVSWYHSAPYYGGIVGTNGEDALGISSEHWTTHTTNIETVCAISLQDLSKSVPETKGTPSVLQLCECVQGQQVVMLVDLGSTASFINQQLASVLSRVSPVTTPVRMKVADDRMLSCSEEIQ